MSLHLHGSSEDDEGGAPVLEVAFAQLVQLGQAPASLSPSFSHATDLDAGFRRTADGSGRELSSPEEIIRLGSQISTMLALDRRASSAPFSTILRTVTLPGKFSLRGELFHAFVSYRVASEGPKGNGLAQRVASRIRALSLESPKDEHLQIPRHPPPQTLSPEPPTLNPQR